MVCSLSRLATGHKCILALFLTVVGWCIALEDSDVDVLRLHTDLNQPVVDRLAFHQTLLHSFPQDDGDSLVVLVIVSTTV